MAEPEQVESEHQLAEYEAQELSEMKGDALFIEIQERQIPVEQEPESPVIISDIDQQDSSVENQVLDFVSGESQGITGVVEVPMQILDSAIGTVTEAIDIPVEPAPEEPAAAIEVPVQEEPEPESEPVSAVVESVSIETTVEPEPVGTVVQQPAQESVQPPPEPESVQIPVSVEEPEMGESSPDLVPPAPAEPIEDLVETSIKQQLVDETETMRQVEIISVPEPGVDIPVATEEEPIEPEPVQEVEQPRPVVHFAPQTSESAGAVDFSKKERPPKKTRRQISEEVQAALADEFDQRNQQQQRHAAPREPSYVTYSSIVPEKFFGPTYTPFSAFVSPEAKYRNRHTMDYVYQPPGATVMSRFDSMTSVGPFGQQLWSTDYVLRRSRSSERRPSPLGQHQTQLSAGPLRRQNSLSAIRHGAVGGYLPRSSSSSCLSDYARMAKYELNRGYGRVFYQEDDFRSSLPERVNKAIERHFNEPLYRQSIGERTENYVRSLHLPYESTVPSFHAKYTGRPYAPYAVTLDNDQLYATGIYRSPNIGKYMENSDISPRVRTYYQSKLDTLTKDLSREREIRQKIDRDMNYINGRLTQNLITSADTRHVIVPTEFALETIYNPQNRFNVLDRRMAGYYPLKSRPFYPGNHLSLYYA